MEKIIKVGSLNDFSQHDFTNQCFQIRAAVIKLQFVDLFRVLENKTFSLFI